MDDHVLDNGTVLPFGLLSSSLSELANGFNNTYKNLTLKVGVIVESYPVTDSKNRTKLATEYDVVCMDRHENKGVLPILYKHCMASGSFGSVPDFFEASHRKRLKKKDKGQTANLNDQNGAVVLVLCLQGSAESGIIIGGFPHPDRKTTVKDDGPRLEGEYNGVNVKVEKDGSTKLTFNGATDNDGKRIDTSQGKTEVDIEKDGSFQVKHDAITVRLDRKGVVTITAKDNLTISCKNATVTASENINANCKDATVTASGTATVEGSLVKLGAGASEAVVKGDTFKKLFDAHIHPTAVGPSGPPSQPLAPAALSKKVKTE